MEFSSDRNFQLWDYHVSHARLLIRSPRSKNFPTNQDIIFYGIHHLDLPTKFLGLTIEAAPAGEAGENHRGPSGSTTFRLITEGRTYHLTAVGWKALENDLELFDSSLDPPYSVRPPEELGRVLAHA